MPVTVKLAYFALAATGNAVAFLLIGIWYVLPYVSRLPLPRALTPLLLFSAFRVNGLFFLVAGIAAADIPKSFAVPTAYGDAAAAALALVAAIALRYQPSMGVALAWAYNVLGSLDLLNALAQVAIRGVMPAHFGATWWLPAVNVPALAVAHFLMFVLLIRALSSGERPRAQPLRP